MKQAAQHRYWWERLAEVKPVWKSLQQCCRKAKIEVMYTVIQALTEDCRDLSIDYKISGKTRNLMLNNSSPSKLKLSLYCKRSLGMFDIAC